MASSSNKLAGIGLAVALLTSAACNNFLAVDNPGSVDAGKLKDSTNAGLLVNGAIAQFQSMYATMALYGGILSDEARSAHVNASYGPLDRRDFNNLNDINQSIYMTTQRSRYSADTTADMLKGYLGENAGKDVRVARMLALAGYSYVVLAESFCSAPINLSRAYTSAELFQQALPRFKEAIAIAQAAKTAGGSAGTVAAADSMYYLAHVGAARAFMNLGMKDSALKYASVVTSGAPNFQFRSYYAEGIPPQAGLPVNPFWNAMGSPETAKAGFNTNQSDGINYSNAALWVVVDSAFIGIKDPRMPMTSVRVKAMDNSMQFVANKAASFGGYVKDATNSIGAPMTPGAFIRVASGLEAQYIAAEASGGVATTLNFVNAQRAANNQGVSTAVTADEILADLRDQRRREFYLDGHRLGDIRRYKAQYGVDHFPSGPYRGSATDRFGTNECYVIPISEYNGNPNLK
jgi:hypothetical protein